MRSIIEISLLVIITLGFSSKLYAQSPSGYLGKKQVLEIGADFLPYPDPNVESKNPGLSVGYKYVVSNRWAFGAYFRLGGYGYQEFNAPIEEKVSSTQTVFEATWYGKRSGTIAPIGLHFTLGLGLNTFSAREETFESISGLGYQFGAGYTYIIKDKFTLTPGMRLFFGKRSLDVDGFVEGYQPSLAEVFQPGIRFGMLL